MNDDTLKPNDMTDAELLDKAGKLMDLNDAIPHGRVLDGHKSEILYAIHEKLSEIFRDEHVDAEITLSADDLGGFSCSVIVQADMFNVGIKQMDGFRAILNHCESFSVDPLADGRIEVVFTVPGVYKPTPAE